MRPIDADALWMEIIRRMDYCEDILEIIENMPTIEPERRTGEWISGAENFNTNYPHECSQCGTLIDMYHGGADDYFFCPICGAKMDGSE